MRRKLVIGLGILLFIGIVGYFLGAAIVMVALIFLGIGYFIARRRKGSPKSKDIVVRLRR